MLIAGHRFLLSGSQLLLETGVMLLSLQLKQRAMRFGLTKKTLMTVEQAARKMQSFQLKNVKYCSIDRSHLF